jgi:hypothetical protein
MKKLVVALSICVVTIAVQSAANAGDEQQKSRADDITTNEVNVYAWRQFGKCNYGWNSVFSKTQNTDTNKLAELDAELERLNQRVRAMKEMERGRKGGFDEKDIPLLLKKFKFLLIGVAYGLYVLFQRLEKDK